MTYKLLDSFVIPAVNQASQTVSGDVTGTTASNTVNKLQGRNISSATPTDGYVLTWVNANNDWEPAVVTVSSSGNPTQNISATTDGYEFSGSTLTTLATVNVVKNNAFNIANGNGQNFDTWISSATLPNARSNMGCCGVYRAALIFGGSNTGTNGATFNGNAWSAASGTLAVSLPRGPGMCGAQNAALIFGGGSGTGSNGIVTYRYNGSSWTTMSGTLTNGTDFAAPAGTAGAALAMMIGQDNSGSGSPSNLTNVANKFNGSAWSTTANMSYSVFGAAGCGTQSAATLCTGSTGTLNVATQRFTGGRWNQAASLNTARWWHSAAGTMDLTLIFGGSTNLGTVTSGLTTVTEKWANSTFTWTNTGSLNTARYGQGAAGTRENALCIGGVNSSSADLSSTELFIGSIKENFPTQMIITIANDSTNNTSADEFDVYTNKDNVTLVVTSPFRMTIVEIFNQIGLGLNQFDYLQGDGMWTAGGSLNTARYTAGGCGTTNTATVFGGIGGASSSTEKYNGTSWTSSGSLNTARAEHAGMGYQNSGLTTGGSSGGNATAISEKFNGTTWSTTGSLNVTKVWPSSGGTQNAAIIMTGNSANSGASRVNTSETFNGTNWTAISPTLSIARDAAMGTGLQNSAICIGGNAITTGTTLSLTEVYNGSVWRNVGDSLTTRWGAGISGPLGAAMMYGGAETDTLSPAITGEKFNGVAWAANTALGTTRYELWHRCGSPHSAMAAGGADGTPTGRTTTETYTVSNTNLIPSGIERYRIKF